MYTIILPRLFVLIILIISIASSIFVFGALEKKQYTKALKFFTLFLFLVAAISFIFISYVVKYMIALDG